MAHDSVLLQLYGNVDAPKLVYLPGIQGDATLASALRQSLVSRVQWIEITYPRTVEWSLEDYGTHTAAALASNSVNSGWLLAESFGSQVAWSVLERTLHDGFQPFGIILCGGFIMHPWRRAVRLTSSLCRSTFPAGLGIVLRLWRYWALLRAFGDPVRKQSIEAFIARRTPEDLAAMIHRLELIIGSDFRRIASQSRIPVYLLTGLWDPIVPWWPVRRWLRDECPGYRHGRVLWDSDHTVLFSKPYKSAEIIADWMGV
jgi:hypothetical protein